MTILPLPLDSYARAKVLGSSTLYEASHLPCAVDSAIRPIWDGAFISAPAYPLECSPGDNLALHLAMERVPRGSVLVVGTGSFIAGYWGEVLTVAAEAAGVVGLVIDGAFVTQGDWVVADDDGVIIIPKADAARTLAEGEARADKEAQMMQALTEGRSTLELMNLTEWRTRA